MNIYKQKFITFFQNISQNKSALFLGIPLVCISLVIIMVIAFSAQESKQTHGPTTNVSLTPTKQPSLNQSPTPIQISRPSVTLDQGEMDKKTRQIEKEFFTKYPWYNQLPLKTNTYFVYFDTNKKVITGLLYPRQSSQAQLTQQVSQMKTDILQQLRSIGVNTIEYPVTWKITPEL